MKRTTPFVFVLVTALLAGCQESTSARLNEQPRPNFPNHADWSNRREAELTRMGLTKKEARAKAQEEWEHLGNSTESYTLYDSTTKQKAEQDKFEDDLAKLPRK